MSYVKKSAIALGLLAGMGAWKIGKKKYAHSLYDMAFSIHRRPPDQDSWLYAMPYETWHLENKSHLQLQGYYLDRPEADFTMVILHGYHDDAFRMSSYAKTFYETFNCDLFLPDLRGHGASQGDVVGYGWLDKEDVKEWLVRLHEAHPGRPIVLFGLSMGGACITYLASEELVSEVKCLVEDCGYSSLYQELDFQCRQYNHLPLRLFAKEVDAIIRQKAGFSMYEADGLASVAKARLPMMFIHGLDDDVVPSQMVFDLYNACNQEKQLFFVKEADHARALQEDKRAYLDVLKQFIDSHL